MKKIFRMRCLWGEIVLDEQRIVKGKKRILLEIAKNGSFGDKKVPYAWVHLTKHQATKIAKKLLKFANS